MEKTTNRTIKCLHCGNDYVPKQKFCSDNCRKRYHESVHLSSNLDDRTKESREKQSRTIESLKENRTEALKPKLKFNINRGVWE